MNETILQGLTITVHELLGDYIASEHALLNQPWWRSLPIPLVFRPIAFDAEAERLQSIMSSLATFREQLRGLALERAAAVGLRETLVEYIRALESAVGDLRAVATRLAGKADAREYGHRQYVEDFRRYEATRARYIDLGEALNQAHQRYGLVLSL